MPKDLVIGVDSSTSACKAIAWDQQGKAVAEGRANFELLSPEPNWYEQKAEDWWDALCQCLRNIAAQVGAERIAAICITHQRESFVPVDENAQPIRNAILWLDNRAGRQVKELDERIGNDLIQELTGKGPCTTQSLPKLVWLHDYEPDVVRRTFKFMDVHAFLVHKLTGCWVTSTASADPMGILDMRRGVWAEDFLCKLNIDPAKFVDIVPPGTVVGEVTRQAAERTGLPPGTPVVAGAGDGQSAGLGANITRAGRAYLNLGTAVVSGAHSEGYVADRAFRTLCSPIAGAFVAEQVLRGGTFTISWFVQQFGTDLGDVHLPLSAEELLGLAASKVPPGSLGLMLVPYWTGVMSPYWDDAATGITVGWTGAHRREHFYRAIMEGIAYEHRLVMDRVGQVTGQPIDEFILMGGGSHSALWCQIVADVHGKPVTRASTTEATNLGAGILAASAVGWYDSVRQAADGMTATLERFGPSDTTHATYDRLYHEVYVGLFPAIQTYVDHLYTLTYGDRA
jgi:sugar (pentulose or hexulose) kinase